LSETGVRTEREKENAEKAVMEFMVDNTRFLKSLEDNVSHIVSGKTLHYRNRWYDEKDSPDEIYIASVQEVYEWKFDGHDYLGEGVAVVDFEASVEIEADDSGGERRDEDGNLDSSRTVTVSGAVSISLDLVDLSRDPAKISGVELLKGATISIDELDDISLVEGSSSRPASSAAPPRYKPSKRRSQFRVPAGTHSESTEKATPRSCPQSRR
jgi:hypothetical protein